MEPEHPRACGPFHGGWHAGPRVAGGPERGWVLARQGEPARGGAQSRQGVVAPRGGGLKLLSPSCCTVLVEAYGQAGQAAAGLQALAAARTLLATTEARWREAEVSRLQGALLPHLPSPEVSQAEAVFRRALDVARRQQAKAFELRAALRLRRLWQQHGKRTAAHALLVPVYGCFTEGLDTAVLQEAQARLPAREPTGAEEQARRCAREAASKAWLWGRQTCTRRRCGKAQSGRVGCRRCIPLAFWRSHGLAWTIGS
jgi:hypothetical protein